VAGAGQIFRPFSATSERAGAPSATSERAGAPSATSERAGAPSATSDGRWY
jgi:hypothetical protein